MTTTFNFRPVTATPTDTTAGRLLKVGDFGVGQGINTPNVDLDAEYYGVTGNTGVASPPVVQPSGHTGNARWAGITVGNVNSRIQIQGRTDADRSLWWRARSSAAWSTYRRFYDTANILGTVSQSSGVPTGAIIERGSNANGEFVKFADGTMICTSIITGAETSSAIGNIFGSPSEISWTLPASFANTSYTVNATVRVSNRWANARASTITESLFRQYSGTSSSTGASTELLAIGRWF